LADDWLAAQYRKAAQAIDAQVFIDHPATRSAGQRRPGAVAGLGAARRRSRRG